MGMIGNMMKGMIKALPKEEREALVLKIMPDMMKQVDMGKMMPNMMKELAGLITMWSLYELLWILLKDAEAKGLFKCALGNLKDKVPAIVEMNHAMMMTMAPAIMPKMMVFVHIMMPNMKEIMPRMMEGTMLPMIKENPEIKEHMLGVMQTMFPHCAMNMFPLIEKDERNIFIRNLYTIMAKSAVIEMDADQKRSFYVESTRAVKKALHTDV
jgi:hypothetical protein